MKEQSGTGSRQPITKANFFSILFFTYTIKIFTKGRFWNGSNLYEVLDSQKSEKLGEELENLWIHHESGCKKKGKKPNIETVLFQLFWVDILRDSILLILSLVPRILQPLLLGNILSYFSLTSTLSKTEVYCYISLLVFFNLMGTVVSVHYKFSSTVTAMKIRIACSSCIQKKILKMRNSVQNNALNLISNDLSRFDTTANYAYYIWGSPLFLISILNLIYYDVGISGLAGVTWFILYMFLQSFFGRWIGHFRNIIAKKTDVRIKLMNEILSNMKIIKMYAWEKAFRNQVINSRDLELNIVKKVTYFKSILYSLQTVFNVLAIFLSLLTMVILKEEITAQKIFKLIMYYYSFNYVVTLMFPLSVTKTTELHQIIKRVTSFMTQKEVETTEVNFEKSAGLITLRNVTIIRQKSENKKFNSISNNIDEKSLMKEEQQNILFRDINLEIEGELLYGITGPVGSGKTTLISAIIGEIESSGNIWVNGSISYVSQEPWFFAGTIKENILFGEAFEEERYLEVIRVCGLKIDFEMLPEQDGTLVGEGGNCLSGGQRSRINLARAIYRNADIYLLDDPFSSVDNKVSEILMEQCILGFLKNKCRLLVTHNLQYLKKCDKILIVDSGRLEKLDTFEIPEEEIDHFQPKSLNWMRKNDDEWKKNEENVLIKSCNEVIVKNVNPKLRKKKRKDIFSYLTSGNHFVVLIIVLLIFIVTQASESSVFLFVSYWTYVEEHTNLSFNRTLKNQFIMGTRRYFYILIFLCIILCLFVSSIIRSLSYVAVVMRSSRTLHNNMLDKVMNSEIKFFEIVDIGHILTRFSKDLAAVDEILPRTIFESGIVVLGIISRILLIGFVNPYLVIIVLAVAALFSHLIKIFVYTSKNMKRIEGNLMGPVLNQVKSTIDGLSTIRAANAQKFMEQEYFKKQDRYSSSYYMYITVTHAFSFAVEFITTIFISIVTIGCFLMQESINLSGSEIGLAITQAMAFMTYLQFCIIQCVQANNNLVAVERIKEYDELAQEPSSHTDNQIDEDWPQYGSIRFNNVKVRYNENLEPALKDLSFKIEANEKIGIVGRTGSGKSSLISSILKLVDVEGDIQIDEKNIQNIPANIIRFHISVLPQDPVLFSGTLRFNLDPFGQFDDHDLYKALGEVGWYSSNSSNCLEDQVMEGSNLSLGQKQLICLARIILRKNKIVLIDEATSNMDLETDKMIQNVIRKQFKDSTVLTIAHRLSTILDYDKIMVIDCGSLVEYANPNSLLQDKSSKFYRMLHGDNE